MENDPYIYNDDLPIKLVILQFTKLNYQNVYTHSPLKGHHLNRNIFEHIAHSIYFRTVRTTMSMCIYMCIYIHIIYIYIYLYILYP